MNSSTMNHSRRLLWWIGPSCLVSLSLLLSSLPCPVTSQQTTSSSSSSSPFRCTFSAPIRLFDNVNDDDVDDDADNEEENQNDGGVTLQHYVDTVHGTVTLKMTSRVGYYGWLGLGVQKTKVGVGGGGGGPTYLAVIGDRLRGIRRYALRSDHKKNGAGVVALDDVHGHLKPDAVFTQQGDEDDDEETTTLIFTQDLILYREEEEDGDDKKDVTSSEKEVEHEITANSTWIWAVGREDNRWDGRHKLHGSFTMDLFDGGCQVLDPNTTETLSFTPSVTPSLSSPTQPPHTTNVGIPVSDVDSDVMGNPIFHDKEPSSKDIFDEFTQSDNDFSATANNSAEQEQSSLLFYDATRTYWLVHGVTLGIAWGVLAPLTVGTALWKNRHSRNHNNNNKNTTAILWTRLHRCLSLSVAVLTLLGYLMALLANRQRVEYLELEQERTYHIESLTSTEGMHALFGMILLVLMLVQGIGECCRRFCLQPPTTTWQFSSGQSSSDAGARVMMVDGFPTVHMGRQQELPPPHGESGNDEDHPSDISLLTTSVYSEQVAVLHMASMLGGDEADTDREDHDDIDDFLSESTAAAHREPSPRHHAMGNRSVPSVSTDADHKDDANDNSDREFNTNQRRASMNVSRSSASNRRDAVEDIDDGIVQKANQNDGTPATSPDTSREEEEVETPCRQKPRCCKPLELSLSSKIGTCWNYLLLSLSLLILGLAWYNCHSGIMLQFDLADWDESGSFFESILLAIFWGFAVGTLVVVLLMYYVVAGCS